MSLVVYCMNGVAYSHPFPECLSIVEDNVLNIRDKEGFKIVSSYSLYNVVRWGVE